MRLWTKHSKGRANAAPGPDCARAGSYVQLVEERAVPARTGMRVVTAAGFPRDTSTPK